MSSENPLRSGQMPLLFCGTSKFISVRIDKLVRPGTYTAFRNRGYVARQRIKLKYDTEPNLPR